MQLADWVIAVVDVLFDYVLRLNAHCGFRRIGNRPEILEDYRATVQCLGIDVEV